MKTRVLLATTASFLILTAASVVATSPTLETLHAFKQIPQGASAPLVTGTDGNFYGISEDGGASEEGTVFQITASGSLSILYSFKNSSQDGGEPTAPLITGSDGTLYGTTTSGGGGSGSVYQISTSGSFHLLHDFSGGAGGGNPKAGLVTGTDGNFYGVTAGGGDNSAGTVFQITPSGGFTTLHSFAVRDGVTLDNTDGAAPQSALVTGSDGNLYGTALQGGSGNAGTVFQITTSGSLTTLYSFSALASGSFTNLDGGAPQGLVSGSDGTLYGLATNGGSGASGVVFTITTSGSFGVLYSFSPRVNGTNSDGGLPVGPLVTGSDGNFYGVAQGGGTTGFGGVFRITPAGQYTFLQNLNTDAYPVGGLTIGADGNFYGLDGDAVYRITTSGSLSTFLTSLNSSDGAFPTGGLVKGSDGNYYGLTQYGGTYGKGTIYQLTASGTLTTVHSFGLAISGTVFGATVDGGAPVGLVSDGNGNFYGTTEGGGVNGNGTVFKLSASGSLTVLHSFGLDLSGSNGDGESPLAGLTFGNDGNLYGTTGFGGMTGNGTVFKITTSGSLTTLYAFKNDTDGQLPGGLALGKNGDLYGTVFRGGSGQTGTIFSITPAGAFHLLHSFAAFPQLSDDNKDGSRPTSPLFLASNGEFYGTTDNGGMGVNSFQDPADAGTAFKMTAGGAVTTLHSFNDTDDGGSPGAGVIEGSDGNFYGTTTDAGVSNGSGEGTVFMMTPAGKVTTLYGFSFPQNNVNADGAAPACVLLQDSDGNFLGTTPEGGPGGAGTVFKLVITGPPPAVKTGASSSVGTNEAALAGTVNPNGTATTAWFEYGPTVSYGGTSTLISAGNGKATVTVGTALTGLNGHTTYHYRIVASNSGGVSLPPGSDATFTTLDTPPLAFADQNYLPANAVGPQSINALANDSDADGDPLTITKITKPAHGTAMLSSANAGNTISYTPGATYGTVGLDTIGYTVSDGFGKTATATVTISINPFVLRARVFSAVITGTDGTLHGTASITLMKTGAFSAAITLDGVKQTVKGSFSNSGDFISGNDTFHLDVNVNHSNLGQFLLSGTIATSGSNVILTGKHAAYAATETPLEAGKYTLIIEPDSGTPASPQSFGYATLSVGKGGAVKATGKLADGGGFSFSTPLVGGAGAGNVAVAAAPVTYGVKGSLTGSLTFENLIGSDIDGTLTWQKPQQKASVLVYPGPFTATVSAIGSRYVPPLKNQLALAIPPPGTEELEISGGGLGAPLVKNTVLTPANLIVVTNPGVDKAALKITTSSGLLGGSFLYTFPPSIKATKLTLQGVLYQKTPEGRGFFLAPTQSGVFFMAPPP